MKHSQHTKLKRPTRGFYGRNEISILGSNCAQIKSLAIDIMNQLEHLSIAYIDADHANGDSDYKDSLQFNVELTNKITYYQMAQKHLPSTSIQNLLFDQSDLVIVNGNHEQANQQIILIDPKKEASLIKRKNQLTNVIAIVFLDEQHILPESIKEILTGYESIPQFSIHKTSNYLIEHIQDKIDQHKAPVNGLILGGGKSSRMGEDKMMINYHGMPQFQFIEGLLKEYCEEVYISTTSHRKDEFPNVITDTFLHLGPYGGILSAFQKEPDSAWFTMPCDVPLIEQETIDLLHSRRNPSKMATCFYNSETNFPEPLITIWEPKAYPILLHYLSLGYSCVRKSLINNDVEVVRLEDDSVLKNVNTEIEKKEVLAVLNKI